MTPERNGEHEPQADDFAEFAELAELLALGPSDVVDEQPPSSVWAGIEAQLQTTAQGGAAPTDRATAEQPSILEPVDDDAAMVRGDSTRSVVDLAEARAKRRFRLALVAGAVAAVLLVGVPLALALRETTPEPIEVAAAADLRAVTADFAGSGEAELVDGQLRLQTIGLDPLDGAVYELWLLELVDGGVKDLVSIGIIESDGTFALDEEIDLDRFRVVDISIEPTDGDPTHSGNSVLRGPLEPR